MSDILITEKIRGQTHFRSLKMACDPATAALAIECALSAAGWRQCLDCDVWLDADDALKDGDDDLCGICHDRRRKSG